MKITNGLESFRTRIVCLITFENLALFSLLVMGLSVLFTSYKGLIYSEIISFSVNDGWCDPSTQGIGAHCFGDYYASELLASRDDPWSDKLNFAYPPLSFYYFNVVSGEAIASFGPRIPLYLNLFLTIVALGLPGLHLIFQKVKRTNSGKWIFAVLVTSSPSLMLIDRGSNNFLLAPLLYFFIIRVRSDKIGQSLALLLAMVLWKPQMAVFGFLFLTKFGVKKFAIATFASVSALILSFALYPIGVIGNVINWIENSRSYQIYAPSPSVGNFSFSSFIGFLESIGAKLLDPSSRFSISENALLMNEVSFISLIFGLVAFGSLFLVRRHVNQNYQLLAVTLFATQMPGTTFGYYLILLIFPLIFMVLDNDLLHNSSSFQRWNYVIYGLLMFVMIPAWPISTASLGIESVGIFSSISLGWTLTHFILSILSVLVIIDLLIRFAKLQSSRIRALK